MPKHHQTKHKTSGHNPLNSFERKQLGDRPAVAVLVQALHWFITVSSSLSMENAMQNTS